MERLNDMELGQVAGGTAFDETEGNGPGLQWMPGGEHEQEQTKLIEFTMVWNTLGYPGMGRTRHEMEELFTQWKKQMYKPSARVFLESR